MPDLAALPATAWVALDGRDGGPTGAKLRVRVHRRRKREGKDKDKRSDKEKRDKDKDKDKERRSPRNKPKRKTSPRARSATTDSADSSRSPRVRRKSRPNTADGKSRSRSASRSKAGAERVRAPKSPPRRKKDKAGRSGHLRAEDIGPLMEKKRELIKEKRAGSSDVAEADRVLESERARAPKAGASQSIEAAINPAVKLPAVADNSESDYSSSSDLDDLEDLPAAGTEDATMCRRGFLLHTKRSLFKPMVARFVVIERGIISIFDKSVAENGDPEPGTLDAAAAKETYSLYDSDVWCELKKGRNTLVLMIESPQKKLQFICEDAADMEMWEFTMKRARSAMILSPEVFPEALKMHEEGGGGIEFEAVESDTSLLVSDPHDIVQDTQVSSFNVTNDIVWKPEAFKLVDRIGAGAYGAVYRAEWKDTHAPLAIKVVDYAGDEEYEEAKNEYQAMKKLNHKNIINYYGIMPNSTKEMWILMELCEVGSMTEVLRFLGTGMPEAQMQYVVKEMVVALVYLHTKSNLIHRDIKSGNVLISLDGTVKLADFGVSRLLSDSTSQQHTASVAGTPHWMAPEIWEEKECVLTALERARRPGQTDTSPCCRDIASFSGTRNLNVIGRLR